MNILDKIVAHKRIEVAQQEKEMPVTQLQQMPLYALPVPSFTSHIRMESKTGIIAEYKRRSPSEGLINGNTSVKEVVREYENGGASAVSVLTDKTFFGGSNNDLTEAKNHLNIPILRKDFIISEYQVHEAKAIGASAILLIAAILSKNEIEQFTGLAHRIGLEVLLELHDQDELKKVDPNADVIGINNRNLKTFSVNIARSIALAQQLPKDMVRITESGISDPETVLYMKAQGFQGFLIGTCFMKEKDPGVAFKHFAKKILMQ